MMVAIAAATGADAEVPRKRVNTSVVINIARYRLLKQKYVVPRDLGGSIKAAIAFARNCPLWTTIDQDFTVDERNFTLSLVYFQGLSRA